MHEKQILLLPGPTAVPPRVLSAMSKPSINHRGVEFKKIIAEVTQDIKDIYLTENDLFLLTSSGTGAMEAAVVNFISPGEKVLIASVGAFGERFKKICQAYGIEFEALDYEWGTAINPDDIKQKLSQDTEGSIKAVLLQHNETSTGVLNDMEAISKAKGDHPALMIVDAVSGLAVSELKTDGWDLDVVISGSQKAFMIPPGLATISVSKKAWEVMEEKERLPFYFNLKMYRDFLAKGETPFTPAVPQFFALKESLTMMKEWGLENIIKRHEMHRDMIRAGVRALGLELLADDAVASPAVTAVCVPQGISPKEITTKLREEHNVVVAGGQAKLQDKTFRIGHLGYVQPADLVAALAALEVVLKDLGQKVEYGKATTAAQEIMIERR